ncbi:hypothetical protein LOZ39_000345 [Ophidiomyces ophidiicola]|nr:hypothetical protein LOZ61_000883 [Ophidiomyces ophidiicola]KAI1925812.1 hypothetical protein LOZ60_003868 [Ophidiomyces ophidiicola]KAI2031862.1 hypothetical protein LOZ45_001312 [Ophidiomyces ophidiicola]KAI2038845.1 hypothetical protein LOZ47_002775 [Ophidiomyces ophidiicola]KAI2050302.1 hypothetical protein LOZ44_003494 [Ophidiomyces ophidiicola]
MAKQSSLSDYPKGLSRIVGMGLSSMVLSLDDFTVLKHPLSEYHYGAVETERRIYERLGHHPRIVKYIRRYGDGIVLERLQYQLLLKPTVQTEIFGLGSVLFELCTTNQPYHNIEDHEVDVLFRDGIFPDTTNLPLGEIILKCWTGKYVSGREVATDVEQIQNKYHGDQKAGLKSSNEKHYYQ